MIGNDYRIPLLTRLSQGVAGTRRLVCNVPGPSLDPQQAKKNSEHVLASVVSARRSHATLCNRPGGISR